MRQLKLISVLAFSLIAQDGSPPTAKEIPWKLQAEFMRASARLNYLAPQLVEAQKDQAEAMREMARTCGGTDKMDMSGKFPACKP